MHFRYLHSTGIGMPALEPVLLFLMLISLASSKGISQTSSKPVATSCQSIECVSLASEIASRMNTSADPCQDFYNYACGNFPNVVKYDPAKDSLFEDTIGLMSDKLEKNIYEMLMLDRVVTSKDDDMTRLYKFTREFYRSCRRWMGQYSMSSLYDGSLSESLLQDLFRHLDKTVSATSGGFASLESTLAGLVRAGGKSLFSLELPDSFAESVLSKDDLNLTETARAEIKIDETLFDESKTGLDKIAKYFASAKIGYPTLKLSDNPSATSGQNDTFQLSDLRSAVFASLRANCTFNYSKSVYTVTELDQLTKCISPKNPFSWFSFFDDLLQAPVDPLAMLKVTSPLRVINFVTFFKSRQTPLQKTRPIPLSQDFHFLVFDWFLSFSTFFPKSLKLEYKSQVLSASQGDSVSECMIWTKTLLQPIVERMYQKAYHREDFKDIKQLIQLIKDASIASVRRQTWITLRSKAAIVKKIQSMQHSIGLDDLTPEQLKSFYNATLVHVRNLNLAGFRDFGKLLSLAACAYVRKNFDILSGGSPVSMFMDINPLVVNAFNWVTKNQIIFPMAILAPPIYHPTYPDYINIGSLGYIIGHEIGHSFDNMGHTINQLGALGHFWDNKTEDNYLERMECVRSRYGQYFLFPGGPSHKSNTTLGNDIADIIGIKAAVEALKMLKSKRKDRPMPRLPNLQGDLSPEQMLFIQAAQSWCIKSEPDVIKQVFGGWPTHSPHHLRVRGVAENTQEFADAFKCRAGKPMNPREKCSFW